MVKVSKMTKPSGKLAL